MVGAVTRRPGLSSHGPLPGGSVRAGCKQMRSGAPLRLQRIHQSCRTPAAAHAFALALALLFSLPPRCQAAADPAALFASNQFAAAAEAYKAAVQADPASLTNQIGLIRSLMRLDRWQDALQSSQALVAQSPASGAAHGLLSLALMRAGSPETAKAEATAALQKSPNGYWGLVATGRVDIWDDNRPAARDILQKAVGVHPDWPEARYYLADASLEDVITPADVANVEAYVQLNPKGYPNTRAMEVLPTLLPVLRKFVGLKPFVLTPAPGGQSTSLTSPFVFSGAYVVVPVTIRGVPLKLLFDTGGGSDIMLDEQAATKVGLPVLARSRVYGVSGVEPNRIYMAPFVGFGGGEFKTAPLESVNSDVGNFDGIFGGAALDPYVVTMDLSRKQLIVAEGPSAAAPPALHGDRLLQIPFHYMDGDVYVPVTLAGKREWAIVDSGADGYALLSLDLARQLKVGRPASQYQEGNLDARLGIGTSVKQQRFAVMRFPVSLRIAGIEQEPFKVDLKPALAASLVDDQVSDASIFKVGLMLGSRFLRTAERVTLDYPRHLLTLELPAGE